MCPPLQRLWHQTVACMVQSCCPPYLLQQYLSAKPETDLVVLRHLSGNVVDQHCRPDFCTVGFGGDLCSVSCSCVSRFYIKTVSWTMFLIFKLNVFSLSFLLLFLLS